MDFGVSNITNLKSEIEEYISFKKLEKGIRSIFVPHSPGVYVCISLNNDEFDCDNKFYKCKAILDIDSLDSKTKDLLLYSYF